MLPKDEYKALRKECAKVFEKAKRAGVIKPITKDDKCVDCGEPATCYEHRNYYKPYDVELVCKACNNKRGQAYPFCEDWSKSRPGLSEMNGVEEAGYAENYSSLPIDLGEYDSHIEYLTMFWKDPDLISLEKELRVRPMMTDGTAYQRNYRSVFFNGEIRTVENRPPRYKSNEYQRITYEKRKRAKG